MNTAYTTAHEIEFIDELGNRFKRLPAVDYLKAVREAIIAYLRNAEKRQDWGKIDPAEALEYAARRLKGVERALGMT